MNNAKKSKKPRTATTPRRDPSQKGVSNIRRDVDPALDVLVSLRSAETFTGHSRDYIRKRLREADIGPAGWRGRNRVWSLEDIWQAVGPNSHTGNTHPDDMLPSDRRAHYQAEMLRLEVARRAAGLVPAAAAEAARRRVNNLMRQMVTRLLDGLSAAGGTPQMIAHARKHLSQIDAVLAD